MENNLIKNKFNLRECDLDYLYELQRSYKEMTKQFETYIDFYSKNQLSTFEKLDLTKKQKQDFVNTFLRVSNYTSDFFKSLKSTIILECNKLINIVYDYFIIEYDFNLSSLKIDTSHSKYDRPKGMDNIIRWYLVDLDINMILEVIAKEIGYTDFQLANEEIAKEYVVTRIKRTYDLLGENIYNIKSNKLIIDSYFSFYGYGYKPYRICDNNRVALKQLFKLLSLYEVETLDGAQSDNLYHYIMKMDNPVSKDFDYDGNCITKFKIVRTGKVQITFDSKASAIDFAKKFLDYSKEEKSKVV